VQKAFVLGTEHRAFGRVVARAILAPCDHKNIATYVMDTPRCGFAPPLFDDPRTA